MEGSKSITVVKVLGQDWTFDFGLSGFRRVEAITGKKMGEITKELGDKTTNALLICQFVQGTLQRFHPDITLDEAGDIATNMGDQLNESIKEALGTPKGGESDENPTQSLKIAS